MKRFAVLFLTVSFFGIAVFGVFTMAKNAGCLSSFAKGVPCPTKSPLAFIAFHLSAFRGFSTAVFQPSVLLAAVALLIAAVSLFFARAVSHAARLCIAVSRELEALLLSARFSARRRTLRWTALHELSPTALFARAV